MQTQRHPPTADLEEQDVFDAIYSRRAVRSYLPTQVEPDQIHVLLQAAVRAPSAKNTQPWSFVVVQDADWLRAASERAKRFELARLGAAAPEELRRTLTDPSFDLCFGAPTLIVTCAERNGFHAEEDCAYALQNLMLAARALDLGTCPIGLAREWLAQPEVKRELGIPPGRTPVTPLIVGHPREIPPPTPRREPEILAWLR